MHKNLRKILPNAVKSRIIIDVLLYIWIVLELETDLHFLFRICRNYSLYKEDEAA